jgi:hypothetical protein
MNQKLTSNEKEIYEGAPSYSRFSPNPYNIIKLEDYLDDQSTMDLGPSSNI